MPAAGALASATRANAEQIAGLTLASVARADATFASGHRITLPFRPLLAAQTHARRQPENQPHAPAARLQASASIARSPPANTPIPPGYPGRGPVYDLDVHRTADDRAVEALLASIKTPCTAQGLATGLGWTLDRTVDALQRLEAGLANTGQILTRLGHHSYALGPRPGLVNGREIARCLRHNREPLDLTAAAVLHRALTCSREDRARDALSRPRRALGR